MSDPKRLFPLYVFNLYKSVDKYVIKIIKAVRYISYVANVKQASYIQTITCTATTIAVHAT
jgi:hypothetical protein